VNINEKEVNKVFEVAGVVRYLFENEKRAEVSNEGSIGNEILFREHLSLK
jgi:hypothetical protein